MIKMILTAGAKTIFRSRPIVSAVVWIAASAIAQAADEPASSNPRPTDPGSRLERTCFQTHANWAPWMQSRSDVAICYGINRDLPARIAQWKAQGYITHFMTGVSWGVYQDYLYGRFDGVNHVDEAQKERNGKVISHGGDVYYMSPGERFGEFLCKGVKQAIDAGAEAIHLEEPEFWVRAGYSEGFKREWKAYYHEDWIPPHSSPDAQYRASKLKYYLYRRALKQVFDFVKAENAKTGKHIKCYVPTHSLINYAHWKIVSPESSLIQVGADGFIAQVWTGTARTPNAYRGAIKERTFETAFLEYGAMMNVVQASGGTVWFLNDPIEDNPDHSWEDYRVNWESTLTASLLWPQVWRFEVMPWPERIFHGRYPKIDKAKRKPGERVEREPMPRAYGSELMTVITALNDMNQKEIAWDCGTRGVGVIVSDTMMFERGDPTPSDEHLGSFYGLALPLLKRGLPVEPVQLENLPHASNRDSNRVLLITYEGMKPPSPEVHEALAARVREGTVVVFVDDDKDPYQGVSDWWNDRQKGMNYQYPREHLFEKLGLARDAAEGTYKIGKGALVYKKVSPAATTYRPEGADSIVDLVRKACGTAGLEYRETNRLVLRRGPYVIGAGLDESIDAPVKTIKGRFVDLFDANLPIVDSVSFGPGSRRLLIDLDRIPKKDPRVIASSCKTLDAKTTSEGAFTFYAEGPSEVEAVLRISLKMKPTEVRIDGKAIAASAHDWDAATDTLRLRFMNSASGRRVEIR